MISGFDLPFAQLNFGLVEYEVIGLFVDAIHWFDAPKSTDAIASLLVVSTKPLFFDCVAVRLRTIDSSISKASKILRDLGVVKTTFCRSSATTFRCRDLASAIDQRIFPAESGATSGKKR